MLAWLKSVLFGGRPSTAADNGNMDRSHIDKLIKGSGKAGGEELIHLANSTSIDEFTDIVACASLVGSAVRDGQIGQPGDASSGTRSFQTFIFTSAQVEALVHGHSIDQSVFLLRKDPTGISSTRYKQFTIGRTRESDIRIVDFAISRTHACIDLEGDQFIIRDCGSRNGTKVNGRSIVGSPCILRDGDTITIGRYVFSFMMPKSLYHRLRAGA